jgi:hypothetical protein
MGEKRNAYRISVGKPEGKRPLGRPRRIKMDLREMGWGVMDWIDLAQDRDQWRALVTRGGPPAWGLGVGLITPHRKK